MASQTQVGGLRSLQRDFEVVNIAAGLSTLVILAQAESSGVSGDEDEGSREAESLGSGPSAKGPFRCEGRHKLRGMPYPALKKLTPWRCWMWQWMLVRISMAKGLMLDYV